MESYLRASDTDRCQTIDALQRHTAEGRLTLDEFAERVDAVNRARTYGELAAVTADLPSAAKPRGARRGPAVTAALIAAVVLVMLLGAAALAGAAGWGDMQAVTASMATTMGCR